MLNNTNIVGYIALLMILGSYFGGNTANLEANSWKGSLAEYKNSYDNKKIDEDKKVIIYLDGKRYEATIFPEKPIEMKFTY